jgi:hypothetical protein
VGVAVYVEPSGRRIEPFGDPPGEALIHDRTVADWQAQAFREAGLDVVHELRPPCLVVPDALFTTGGALRAFVDAAAGRDAVLVLKASRFGEGTVPVQPDVERVAEGWRFSRVRFVSGRGESPVDVVFDPQEKVIELPGSPFLQQTGPVTIGVARHPLMTLHHWVHILWANQVAGSIELMATPKWKWIARGLGAAVRAGSFNRWKVLSKLNRIGKRCDIHPTAVVEGSVIGDGVSIGPFARVLFSHLGDGASVMTAGQVEFSVVGARALVSQQTVVRFCVLYPEAVAGQYLMQQCILGRQAVTTAGAYAIDLNFEQSIRVPLDGKLHDSGTRFLGSAFGHRCRVGTGFWMASGRMVPNGCFLIRDPDEVLSRIPANLEGQGPVRVIGREAVPLSLPPGDRDLVAGGAQKA